MPYHPFFYCVWVLNVLCLGFALGHFAYMNKRSIVLNALAGVVVGVFAPLLGLVGGSLIGVGLAVMILYFWSTGP